MSFFQKNSENFVPILAANELVTPICNKCGMSHTSFSDHRLNVNIFKFMMNRWRRLDRCGRRIALYVSDTREMRNCWRNYISERFENENSLDWMMICCTISVNFPYLEGRAFRSTEFQRASYFDFILEKWWQRWTNWFGVFQNVRMSDLIRVLLLL